MSQHRWTSPAADLMMITAVWLVCEIIVNPVGDFPLNDDWAFGWTVQHLLATRSFFPSGWDSMSLLTNVLWGSLFCWPAGFSFTALRFSTITASWLGILGTYLLLKELHPSRWLRLLGTWTLAFNPIYFALSNTFMTDVLSTVLTIFAALFLLRTLKTDSRRDLLYGAVFSVASVLSRQCGLAVPLAFVMVFPLRHGFRWRVILRAAVPLALSVVILVAFEHWLAATGRLPDLYNLQIEVLIGALHHPFKRVVSFGSHLFKASMYLGLFLSPMLLFGVLNFKTLNRRNLAWHGVILAILAAILASFGFRHKDFLMPLSENILDKFGIGPVVLHDTVLPYNDTLPEWPRLFWVAATLLSMIGCAIMIQQMCSFAASLASKAAGAKMEGEQMAIVFMLLITIIYLVPLMVIGFYDRYLMAVVPFLGAGLGLMASAREPAQTPFRFCIPVLLLAGFGVVSVPATRDYLEFNRVRWAALKDLVHVQSVKPTEIDGGFEFNGYYLYDPKYLAKPGEVFWWVQDDLYVVALQPLTNYTVAREYRYDHWLPPYHGSLWVLKRNPETVQTNGVEQTK